MLIRTSGAIYPDFYLLSLGDTCRYLVVSDAELALFDPGASVHSKALIKRIEQFKCDPTNLKYVFISHLHADRIGCIPALKQMCPDLRVVGTEQMQTQLKDQSFLEALYAEDLMYASLVSAVEDKPLCSIDDFKKYLQIDTVIAPARPLDLTPERSVRTLAFAGHSPESVAYYISSFKVLIADEGLGYYNSGDMVAPGADQDIVEIQNSIKSLKDLEIQALCCPSLGAVTGDLVSKFLHLAKEGIEDLMAECRKAFKDAYPKDYIKDCVYESFYKTDSADPIVKHNLDKSFNAVWKQLEELTN